MTHTIERLKREREGLRHMIADASHELRTPLTALKTFNTLLQQELAGAAPAASFLRESEKQIEQMERLTSGMLDLSRFEARLSGTDFVLADLRAAVADAVHSLRALSAEREQEVTVRMPDEPVECRHDPRAMQQAISNLLHNAIKFTPAGGHIHLTLEVTSSAVQLAVQDDGPGIPVERQSQIFERFYRYPDQTAAGSGLGLAICREIVAIHQGQVTLDSSPGQGCRFTIGLPLLAGTEMAIA